MTIVSKIFHFKNNHKMAKKPPVKKERPKPMNAREHLFAFTGGLMMRKATLICDQEHEASAIAEICGAYADANKLPAFRDNCRKAIWPEGTDYITNVPRNDCNVAKPIDLDDVLAQIFFQLGPLTPEDQNAVIAKMLKGVQVRRQERHQKCIETQGHQAREEGRAYNALRQFENILAGNFSVID